MKQQFQEIALVLAYLLSDLRFCIIVVIYIYYVTYLFLVIKRRFNLFSTL